jgi:hypothetical protein
MQPLQLGLTMSALIQMLAGRRLTRLTPGLAQTYQRIH